MAQSMVVWLLVVIEAIAFGGILFGLCALVSLVDKLPRGQAVAKVSTPRPIRIQQPRLWA
jgi:hypothetical protein